MSPFILLGIFVVSTFVGYILIKNVPSLLHTPLMSGMNALSGITILGALVTAVLLSKTNIILASIVGGAAIILAMINVVGGFYVTDRMLGLFHSTKEGDK